MKIVYDDVEIEAGPWIVFLNTSADEPVYHSPLGRRGREGEVYVSRTACGRVYWRGGVISELIFPTKHAALFGRPCSLCWPAMRELAA